MEDLNDLYYFAEVVTHRGFAPAGRKLGVPKSKLSRRVAGLEARLGVRLIERSTRRFRVTDVGSTFYDRCRTILAEVEQAEALAAEARSEPRGLVRVSCPTGLVGCLMTALPAVMQAHPLVQVQLVAADRAVDLIGERIDVAVRVRTQLDTDAELTVRALARSTRILVAAKSVARLLRGRDGDVEALQSVPTLSSSDDTTHATWRLVRGGEQRVLRLEPRFSCVDFDALLAAAIAGLGVAFLPDHTCARALANGTLVRVLPDWEGIAGTIHLVFTTRRGLPPAVRVVLDTLATAFAR